MKNILIPMLLAGLVACSSSDKESKAETDMQLFTDTTPEAIKQTDSLKMDAVSSATSRPNEVSFNGTLVIPPQNYATVTLTMGGTIKNTFLLPGAYVTKGTVLATLENPEFITLQQEYLDSRAQLEYLEAEYNRQQILSQEQAASQKKLQQSKADYLSMKSRLQAADAKLALLGVSGEELQKNGVRPYHEVKAPLSGYTANVKMNLGKHMAAGEPLCDVINKDEILIRLIAYEKDLANIHVGDLIEFAVNGIGAQKFRGKLISVGQQVDEVSRSLEVYARADSRESFFRPGMYVAAQDRKSVV